MNGALTSLLRREIRGGLETVEFEISPTAIAAILKKAERLGDSDYLNEALCDYYASSPKPDKSEVLSKSLGLNHQTGRVRVRMTLVRNHLVLEEVRKILLESDEAESAVQKIWPLVFWRDQKF